MSASSDFLDVYIFNATETISLHKQPLYKRPSSVDYSFFIL